MFHAPQRDFWGLVKQTGPWAQAPSDKLRCQTGIEKLNWNERPYQQNGSKNLPSSSLKFTGDGGNEKDVRFKSVVGKNRLNKKYQNSTKPDFDLKLLNPDSGESKGFDKPKDDNNNDDDDDYVKVKPEDINTQINGDVFYDAKGSATNSSTSEYHDAQGGSPVVDKRSQAIDPDLEELITSTNHFNHFFSECRFEPVKVPVVVTKRPSINTQLKNILDEIANGTSPVLPPSAGSSPSISFPSVPNNSPVSSTMSVSYSPAFNSAPIPPYSPHEIKLISEYDRMMGSSFNTAGVSEPVVEPICYPGPSCNILPGKYSKDNISYPGPSSSILPGKKSTDNISYPGIQDYNDDKVNATGLYISTNHHELSLAEKLKPKKPGSSYILRNVGKNAPAKKMKQPKKFDEKKAVKEAKTETKPKKKRGPKLSKLKIDKNSVSENYTKQVRGMSMEEARRVDLDSNLKKRFQPSRK